MSHVTDYEPTARDVTDPEQRIRDLETALGQVIDAVEWSILRFATAATSRDAKQRLHSLDLARDLISDGD